MIGLREIEAARQSIAGKVHRTPLLGSQSLSEQTGLRLFFKQELFQKTGSFKVRGVFNKLGRLSAEQRKNGVVSMSSGNHAQALSYAAGRSGIDSVVVMPAWSRAGKVEATRGYGGRIVLTEGDLMSEVARLQEEEQRTFVHPFDDPLVIAGQGTVGLELIEDLDDPDYVLVTVGGGGLISGVAAAIKERSPTTKVIGIEPEGAPAMSESLRRGTPVRLESTDTIADGLAAPFAGEETFKHVRRYVDEMLLVSDEEIVDALRLILERLKLVAEPSAAAALVPILTRRLTIPPRSKVVVILCGGNVDSSTLAQLLS